MINPAWNLEIGIVLIPISYVGLSARKRDMLIVKEVENLNLFVTWVVESELFRNLYVKMYDLLIA